MKSKIYTELIRQSKRYKGSPTNKNVRFWFNLFNKEIFGGKLILNTVTVEYMDDHYGWTDASTLGRRNWNHIQLSSDVTFMEFIRTLGHEMVHLYQYQVMGLGDPDGDPPPEPGDEVEGEFGAFRWFKIRFDKFGIDIDIR